MPFDSLQRTPLPGVSPSPRLTSPQAVTMHQSLAHPPDRPEATPLVVPESNPSRSAVFIALLPYGDHTRDIAFAA